MRRKRSDRSRRCRPTRWPTVSSPLVWAASVARPADAGRAFSFCVL